MGLGAFAGGLASGWAQGQRMAQQREEEERRRKEYERQEGARRAAANTFGNVGAQREDGSTYDDESAYADYAKQVAQYDPEASMRSRTQGLQHKKAKREERYAANEESWLAFQRSMAGADDETYFREAAKFATKAVPDGKAFGIDFDANTGYSGVMVDSEGRVARRPIGSRQELEQMLSVYVSPGMYKQTQEHGLKSRQTAADERRAGAAERTAGAAELRARSGAVVDRAHARYYDRERQNTPPEQLTNFVDEKGNVVPYSFNRRTRGFEALPLPKGMRLPTQRAGQISPLGNTGLLTDGQRVFRVDERTNTLVEMPLPGESLIDRLKRTRPGDGQPSMGVPSPGFVPTDRRPNLLQRFFGLNRRPDAMSAGPQLYQDPLTGEAIDAETWHRKYGENPPA